MNKNKKYKKYSEPMRKIAVFVIILTVFTVFSAGSNVFRASAIDYQNHWAKNIFDEWIRAGILVPDSDGNIYPENLITRGQLCSYINRVMGFASMADISQYTDTPYGSQYYNDMAAAVYAGYITPSSGNALSPSGYITRGQVVDAFVKVARITPSYGDETILSQVRDASDIPSVNRSTVAAAIVNGFLAGRPGYMIEPNDYMTVSEAVVLLDRLNSSRRVYAFPGQFGPDNGSVTSTYSAILAPGVTLRNAEIAKELDIQQETGEGEVNLNKVNVREKLLVNGGRIITLANSNMKEIQINKRGANLVYAQDGNSEADTLVINGDNVTVNINKGNKTRKIIINGANATVNVGENVRIEELTVNGENARVNLAKGSRIDKAALNAKTQIFGKDGSVGDLTVNPGGTGSEVEPRPGGNVDLASGADVTIDNRPSSSAAGAKKILSLAFDTPLTLRVSTEDTGKVQVTKNDFVIDIDGTPTDDYTVSKSNSAEFNLIFNTQISPSSQVTVAGTGNLTGSAAISQNSQSLIKDAVVNGLRTINVTVANPENKALSKDNFRLQAAGKDTDAFTVSAVSLSSYNLTLTADIKNGQILTVSGKNGLAGSITVSAVSAIKSIVFNDTEKFTVNTDNTAGNKIDTDSFDISVNGSPQDFTVAEKSKTAYQITLPSDIGVGDKVTVEGKRYLTGKLEEQYASPFKVSKVSVAGKTAITITLSSAPEAVLTGEKHSGAFKVLVGDVSIPVTGIKKDSSDTKNTVYSLTVDLDGKQGVLSVNGIKDSKNKGMVDYVSPELVSVRLNDQPLTQASPNFRAEKSKARIIIDFTEPAFKQAAGKISNKDVAASGAAFNIISGAGAGMDLNGTKVSATANSVIIDLAGAKLMDPGIYTLSINSALIYDALGNVCSAPANNVFRFEIKGTLPTVTSAIQAPNGDLQIKLNGATAGSFGDAMSYGGTALIIDPTNSGLSGTKKINYTFISYDSKSKTVYVSRAALPPALDDPNNPDYLSGDIPYRVELYHRDYTREAGQDTPENENPLIISRVKIDTQRPRIEKVILNGLELYDKDTGLGQNQVKVSKANAVIQVVFSKPVFEQPPSKKFSLIDNYGQAFNIDTADPLDPGNNLSLQGVKPASSNRTVSIPLRSAAIMNPGDYKLEIDPSLIFDAVGNSADVSDFKDLPGFPNLTCYFSVVIVPPKANSVTQNSNGDIQIRFTRYYTWLINEYGKDVAGIKDVVGMGILRILDPSKPEGQQQVGSDINAEFLSWTDATKTLTVERLALPVNLSGNYVIEIDCPDYEKLTTPNIRLVTGTNNDPAVTIGGEKNIPLTPNAEQARIITDDALIKILFPVNVNKLSIEDLSVTGDMNSYPFTIYAENGAAFDKSKITLTHSGGQIVVNLTKAVTADMIHTKITVSVNQMLIYNAKGVPVGNKITTYGFTPSMAPLPATRANQIAAAGNVEIIFGKYTDDDSLASKAHNYINDICGLYNTGGSTVRIERRGETIGYIPAEYIKGGIEYEGIAPEKIIIKKDALDMLADLDGNPVNLDGKEYTVVLSHSNYADNRVNCNIDTTPPELKNYDAGINGNQVTLNFTFDEDIVTDTCAVRDQSGNLTTSARTENKNTVTITFTTSQNTAPSDYNVTFKVKDNFGNVSSEFAINPFIASRHTAGISAGSKSVSGFAVSAYPNESRFSFGEASNFTSYFDKTTRKVSSSSLIASLAAETPAYDSELSAPVVTLKAEMAVTAPNNAASCKYIISKDLSLQTKPVFENELTIENGKIILTNDVNFHAAKSDGKTITSAEIDSDRAGWTWTVEKLTGVSYYYIFEWTDGAGNKSYTYVRSEISGS